LQINLLNWLAYLNRALYYKKILYCTKCHIQVYVLVCNEYVNALYVDVVNANDAVTAYLWAINRLQKKYNLNFSIINNEKCMLITVAYLNENSYTKVVLELLGEF